MGLLNMDGIALMSFSTEEVIEAWRESVQEQERQKTQQLDESNYQQVAHLDSYSRSAHVDTYDRSETRNIYSRRAGVDLYTRRAHTDIYTQAARIDSYSEVKRRDKYSEVRRHDDYTERAHRDRYSRGSRYTDRHTRVAHTDRYNRRNHNKTYSPARYGTRRGAAIGGGYAAYGEHTRISSYRRRAHRNSYTDRYSRGTGHSNSAHRNRYERVAHTNNYTEVPHTNKYSDVAHRNTYSRNAAIDSYNRVSHTDSYTRVPHKNSYSQRVAQDTYEESANYDKGFDHSNYVPSAPEIYDLEGNVISGTLDIYLASYDANNDGLGSQDQESKDIYYTVKIRQTHDIAGNEVNGEWKVLQEGAKTDELTEDISNYSDGIYELSTQAYNLPRSEKGVTKNYVSEERIISFTISEGGIGSVTAILNAEEFYDYVYGLETYSDREGDIQKYIDSIIYKDERLNEHGGSQQGLFLIVGLEDEDTDTYHKTMVSLEKDGNVIASDYELVYETNEDGSPKAGNKEGVVFIPLEDMLDNGSFDDVKIMLTTTEYTDEEMTQEKGETVKLQGVTEAGVVVLVDLDAHNPNIFIGEPHEGSILNVPVSVSDIGSGILGGSMYYQVTYKDKDPVDSDWEQPPSDESSFVITLDEPGVYDIYVKVMDRAGNETMGGKGGYVVTNTEAILTVPEKARPGETISAEATINTDKVITETKFWIDGYSEPIIGIADENGNYTADIKLPDNIPLGQHDVYFEAVCEDGTVIKTTDTIEIVNDFVILNGPSTATPDSVIEVSAEVDSDKEIKKVEFWLENEEGTIIGDKTPGNQGPDGDYITNLIIPEDQGEGIIKIVVEVTYSDGSTSRTEKTLLVISEGLISDSGVRFISKDYIYTLNENGQWTREELEEIFDNDEPIYEDDI